MKPSNPKRFLPYRHNNCQKGKSYQRRQVHCPYLIFSETHLLMCTGESFPAVNETWPEADGLLTISVALAERDGTRSEIRIRLFPKRTSPFKSVGVSV